MNRVYVYEAAHAPGELKVGQTDRDDVHTRIREQLGTANVPYTLLHQQPALRLDGSTFTDRDVHTVLERMGCTRLPRHTGGRRTEWFRADLDTVRTAIAAVVTGTELDAGRYHTFGLRPEQRAAVAATAAYFRKHAHPQRAPHFLWNAKMRFGKTFTTYQLALEMGWRRLLVLTYKPAVADSWRDDLLGHVDFAGWQFVDKDTPWEVVDETRPFVWFASFQDVLGLTEDKQIKERNEVIDLVDWDCVVLDEYHFGAWRENAKDLFSQSVSDEKADKAQVEQEPNVREVERLQIETDHYLYLSGTPFRAIADGEFQEDQIFNWTYPDEQHAKLTWSGPGPNPYRALPAMQLHTYLLGDTARSKAAAGEVNEFTLTDLFHAKQTADGTYLFSQENYVRGWLDTITGRNQRLLDDDLNERAHGVTTSPPPFPYASPEMRARLRHTVWYLPDVAACRAMSHLLAQDPYFGGPQPAYRVVNIGGTGDDTGRKIGVGAKALEPVRAAVAPDDRPTITLSCGKLMTGVTVKQWSGIFMLRASNSPESYFQAAFRVQSPWTQPDADQDDGVLVLKDQCYVFDFDPQRALRLLGEFALSMARTTGGTPEDRVREFTAFLPIYCYDDGQMHAVDATDVLTIANAGTTSAMMARKWRSASLVLLDGDAFEALLGDTELKAAIAAIESFRTKKVDLDKASSIILAGENALKKSRAGRRAPTPEEDEAIKAARKEKQLIREQLIAFLQRIPAFMYTTDAREQTLHDVILQNPRRFERTTGLSLEMFKRLHATGLLNDRRINDAIIAFKLYEDASLDYAGNFKDRSTLAVGGFDVTMTTAEAQEELDVESCPEDQTG